jgi:hypothetical protein
MQITHDFERGDAIPVAWGVRVLLLSGDTDTPLLARIASLGGTAEVETEVFAALAAIIDDPLGYGLFIIDCDGLGGADVGQRAAATLVAERLRVPVILISSEHGGQVFPQEKNAPIQLRAPLSTISLRVGFEHALRDRLIWRAA